MSKENCAVCKKTSIGGQAVIEGIMMRGPERTVLAVRTPEKEIATEDVEFFILTSPAFPTTPPT